MRKQRKEHGKRGIALCLAVALSAAVLAEGAGNGAAAATETATGGAVTGGAVSGGAVETATPTPTIDVSAYKPATPAASVRGGSKRVRVTWGKISGADGYYIYSRESSAAAYTKVATITGGSTTEYVKKSLAQNTTYYFRLSAYKKVGDQTVESDLSTAVSAKTAAV